MRIVYHPTGSALKSSQLRALLDAALLNMSTPALPLVALDMGLPDYPYQIEPLFLSDDRRTLGGTSYSRINAILVSGTLNFSNIHSSEVAGWRAMYSATQGMRLPFAVELPDGRCIVATAAGERFPLALVDLETWDGSITITEQP